MVFMPPGSAKSTYSSIRFITWYLGRWPTHDIIQASNTAELASRFGRKARNLIDSKRYASLFDVKLAKDSQAKGQWEVIPGDEESGGEYYAIGVEGAVTGRRADGGVIDDPLRGKGDADSQRIRDKQWDWYLTDFCTRIKPGGWKVIIQTRWHEDDLSGRILPEDWNGESGLITARDGEEWYVLCLPAQAGANDPLGRKPGEWLWTEWFAGDFWEQTKRRMPPREWSALYQQTPTPDEGSYYKREHFRRFRLGEEPSHLHRYITSDFAVSDLDSADSTVFGDWGLDYNGHYWLLDRYKEQADPGEWVNQLVGWFKDRGPMAFVGEGGVIRKAVEPFLENAMRNNRAYTKLEWIARTRDKVAMSAAFRGMCDLGMIHIPLTDWGEDFITELLKFPSGANDDDADMASLLGLAANKGIIGTIPDPEEELVKRDRYFSDDEDESWKTM